MDRITFYLENTLYGEFCNFYELPSLIYKEKSYPTSEHLYQALKYIYKDAPAVNIDYAELIRTASTPNKAKILANRYLSNRYKWQQELSAVIKSYKERGVKPREDWETAKVQVMRTVLQLKFLQDAHCRRVLLDSGDSELVEASPRDSFWGGGSDGRGANILGKLLMELRQQLKSASATSYQQSARSEANRLQALEKRKFAESEMQGAKRLKVC